MVGRCIDAARLGGTGASHPDFGDRQRRRAARDRACGYGQQRAASPMVVSLLPLMRAPDSRSRTLALAAHFTAVSMWIESLRLLPGMPRENRIAFSSGLGFLSAAQVGTLLGYHLANSLPPLLTAAVLFSRRYRS